MSVHWRKVVDWKFELAPVFMALGAGILLMVHEEMVSLFVLVLAVLLECLEVEAKPKKKKAEKLAVQ